ncbi:MAG: hypothetical protein AUK47_27020 [Deltaproteobacteria bacterium CG2_30_63_29]|nr:MAG: hypothetical protein AUK47_27020 [Deltaproteobacteria bacterium CG2_30_63_29]PIV98408.1 MAG: hypothetical protein COW42_14810 [Deltaproteobacteria bacterium CG17_big_fil_post_rev_8_21_14_2_50_63_7]
MQGEFIKHGGAGAWDEGATATPGAMVRSDGQIYVFYAGFGAGGQHMSVGVASGSSLLTLKKHAQNPILVPAAGAWDGGQVSMARPIQEGSYTCLAYEGANLDFTCEATNRYGWGLARSLDLVNWERLGSNPLGLSAQNPYGCGNDMPSIYRRDWDQVVFVYHTSADTRTLVREFLAVD